MRLAQEYAQRRGQDMTSTNPAVLLIELDARGNEIERLQKALAFWLPHRPATELPPDLTERLEHDIGLLAGYMGKMEPDAEERGWIRLSHSITNNP